MWDEDVNNWMNSSGNFILTLLDSAGNDLEKRVAQMLDKMMDAGRNKVLWWNNRGIRLRFRNQYQHS